MAKLPVAQDCKVKRSPATTLCWLAAIGFACAPQKVTTDAQTPAGDSGPGQGPAGDSSLPGDSAPQVSAAALAVTSFPKPATGADSAYQYKIALNQAGDALFAIARGPAGATITSNGAIRWLPGPTAKAGKHEFEVVVFLGEERIDHSFAVHVSAVEVHTAAEIAADVETTTTVSVDSPLSPIRGSSVVIPPQALQQGGTIRIGLVEQPPVLPAADPSDSPTVVDFGPSGTVFSEPVSIVVPLADSTIASLKTGTARAEGWTFGEAGVWQRLNIEHLDLDSGTAVIKTKHFSQFTVIGARAIIESLEFLRGGPKCRNSLVARLRLARNLNDFPASWINGVPDTWAADDLRIVLGKLSARERIQLAFSAEVAYSTGTRSVPQSFTLAIERNVSASTFDLIIGDGAGTEVRRFSGVALDGTELTAILDGSMRSFIFDQVNIDLPGHATFKAYAYLRNTDSGLGLPASLGFPFAEEAVDFVAPTTADADGDCDAQANLWDETPDGIRPPVVEARETTVRTVAEAPVDLRARLFADDPSATSITWTANSAVATLTPVVPDATGRLSAVFVSPQPGSYEVVVRAVNAGGEARAAYTVFVDEPDPLNTPPRCRISASATTIFVGERVDLGAVLEDQEQTATELRAIWSVNHGQLSQTNARTSSFRGDVAGEYEIRCIADDGVDRGLPGRVVVSVVEQPQNTPPRLVFVTPLTKTLEVEVGSLARVPIQAFAEDVDGDAVAYEMSLLEGEAILEDGVLLTRGVFSRLFVASQAGSYAILVRASDANGALSDSMVVKIFVTALISEVDADQDGFPAGMDCDDSTAAVFPGALEICGDGIDQNCSGADKPASACDADRDGFSSDDGDCDDSDPGVHPKAYELCNGRDDNCNDLTDEGYPVARDCSAGEGACRAVGVTICSASGLAAACAVVPGVPTAETCDGLDNDCNGAADDVDPGTTTAQDVNNCGGCGVACVAGANEVASCERFPTGTVGCVYSCAPGSQDIDGSSLNGCEYTCAPTSGGVEICDGVDNDCDGTVDEGTDDYTYSGPVNTVGIGTCRRSKKVCRSGQLVVEVAEVAPTVELCDGRDNDCDGRVDEDYTIGAACDSDDSDLCATGIATCSADGTGVVCTNEAYRGALDICDGFDNDCNPSTADGSQDSGLGNACDGADTDLCTEGTKVCESGTLVCTDTTADQLDTCDGADNDCDPSTADGTHDPLVGVACDGDDADSCKRGVYICGSSGMECSDTFGAEAERCDGSGADADCDGASDCDDSDCASTPLCLPEICDDGNDNNGDALVDCMDPQCFDTATCPTPPEICGDRVDNDRDGSADCADSDCSADPECGPEVCDDEFDNDGDGASDCADTDCAAHPRCGAEVCTDLFDNDGDGLLDCDDSDCRGTSSDCVAGAGAVGAACGANTDCGAVDGDPVCVGEVDPGFPGGYCAEFCSLDSDDCPTGSVCSDVGFRTGRGICFKACTDVGECRAADGYVCAPFKGDNGGGNAPPGSTNPPDATPGPTVCLPMCSSDDQCPTAGYCDVERGECTDTVEICANGLDDDDDGQTDCGDYTCRDDPSCFGGAETCDGGVDDDGDGAIDCDDPDCDDSPLCSGSGTPEDCRDGIDNNGDGKIDCDDPLCEQSPECLDQPGELCTDGVDNDGDLMVDCADPECWSSCGPLPGVEACSDREDNDGDGLVDCADSDCTGKERCGAELCDDEFDNDGDGAQDCSDSDCSSFGLCGTEVCTDLFDNDGDQAIDCEDPDCASDAACVAGTGVVGTPCTAHNQCAASNGDPVCPGETAAGFPGGYCSEFCSLSADDCPTGSSCIDVDLQSGNGICFADCVDKTTCRAVYDCRPHRPEQPVTVCMPACVADFECPTAGYCDYEDGRCSDSVEICGNGVDDNQNGRYDCGELRCVDGSECLGGTEDCSNGADDDNDGARDCEDPDCWNATSCTPASTEQCGDGVDNNGDGLVDCNDPQCEAGAECNDLPGEICTDQVDNDGDLMVDCADPECWSSCGPPPGGEDCRDGVDNDGDGMVDCADSDCVGRDRCGPEVCDDEYDNDGDGARDCADTECSTFVLCGAETCGDFFDNDGDDAVDCEDSDCASDALCVPGSGAVGTACTTHSECSAQNGLPVCAAETRPGFPGGYCSEFCTLGTVSCPTGATCVDVKLASGNGVCLADCVDSSTCRAAHDCRPADESGPLVCLAACTADADCPVAGYCDFNDGWCSTAVELCGDGVDNDNNDRFDCGDLRCAAESSCSGGAEDCGNGVDDDADGAWDCDDPDCTGVPPCNDLPGEQCTDGVDNDGDLMVDCADPECWASCGPPPN